jgi:microcystin-dependent protein
MPIISPLPNTLQNGTPNDATQVMADLNQIVSNVNANAAGVNQSNAFTQPNTGVTSAVRAGVTINSQVQDGSFNWCGTAGGSANALTLTPAPAIPGYTAGQSFGFLPLSNNTGPATVQISGLGTPAITKNGAIALAPNDLVAGKIAIIEYDGTQFQLTNPRPYQQGANVVCAATLVLDGTTGDYLHITTGVNTVTAITLAQGDEKELVTDVAVTFNNGASLITLSGGNVTTAVGDIIRFRGEASGVVRMVSYSSANGIGVPSGSMLDFAGTSAPSGWLGCDGSSQLRASYPSLFAAIGTTWGSADGSHFNLPNFQRRVAVGSGGSGSGTLGNAVGNTGGEEAHTMALGELVTHHHVENVASGGGSSFVAPSGVATNASGASGVNTADTGSSTPFNVMQPSAVVLKIIKI